MIFEILALIFGILIGTITGLAPAIHVNLVSAFLISSLTFFSFVNPMILVVFIVAMSITHTFIDFIPSIFLGAPDEDTSLSVLPGHELLNRGGGYEAVILTLYGSAIGIIIIIFFTPLFIFILPKVYPYIKTIIFFVLLFVSVYLISREKSSMLPALIIFLLSGFLGIATLNLQLKESLLPLLTGLFGSSSLITSIMKKTELPKQKLISLKEIKIDKKELLNSVFAAMLSAPLCSFLPALGSGQAAVIGSDVIGETNRKQFLILLGSINTIVTGLAFIALFAIQKARTGTAVAVQKILENFSFNNLVTILITIVISGFIAFFLTIFLAKFFSKNIAKFNYQKLSFIILIFISLVVLIFSGFLGFLVFVIATATGLVAILIGVRRTNLMGCLVMPAILLYLPI